MGNDQANDRQGVPDPDPRVQFQLGSMLRQVYGTVITEPVPDRFSALLNQLAHAPEAAAVRVGESIDLGLENAHVEPDAAKGNERERT